MPICYREHLAIKLHANHIASLIRQIVGQQPRPTTQIDDALCVQFVRYV